ncbi:MAG: PIN domain-containing protein [Acidobacteriota bacterium]
MNGINAILDSNTIIFATREKIDIEELFSRYDQFYASVITYIEVYAFDFQNTVEKDIADEIFANLQIIEVTQEIADQAIIYRKNKTKKIKLPDAIILASAKYANADLLTDDWDDFQNIDSTVIVKDIDDLKI